MPHWLLCYETREVAHHQLILLQQISPLPTQEAPIQVIHTTHHFQDRFHLLMDQTFNKTTTFFPILIALPTLPDSHLRLDQGPVEDSQATALDKARTLLAQVMKAPYWELVRAWPYLQEHH